MFRWVYLYIYNIGLDYPGTVPGRVIDYSITVLYLLPVIISMLGGGGGGSAVLVISVTRHSIPETPVVKTPSRSGNSDDMRALAGNLTRMTRRLTLTVCVPPCLTI